jgi:hypothetical protein
MKGIFNTLKTEIKAALGSQLTKNYEVEKEPYMTAGMHQLWHVFRAKRRNRENENVSIFILDKKTWDKKKSEVNSDGNSSLNMKE